MNHLFSVFRRRKQPPSREPWVRRPPALAPGRHTEDLQQPTQLPGLQYPLKQPISDRLPGPRVIPALRWVEERGLQPIRRQATGEISLSEVQRALPAPVTPPDWLVSAIPERFQVDDDPTVAREEPALYQLQRLARARQREMSRE